MKKGVNLMYIRVSSADQNEDRQLVKAQELGIEERFLFVDKASGKNFDRPNYQAMKRVIREGDTLYIDALDRLVRDYDGIINEWKDITRRIGADIIVLENTELFDSRKFKSMGDVGKLLEDQFLSMLSYVAEQERKKIRQRQAEGIAVAKAQGKHLRRPKLNLDTLTKPQLQALKENYAKWKANEITGVQFAEIMELKKNSFYKIVKEYEGKGAK